jgi:hypothetical protein
MEPDLGHPIPDHPLPLLFVFCLTLSILNKSRQKRPSVKIWYAKKLYIHASLKFPNGQFPLKIPGPISQATLEQNKKIKKFTRGGVYTWVGKGYFSERINQKRFF